MVSPRAFFSGNVNFRHGLFGEPAAEQDRKAQFLAGR